jgi:hypothetical protein
MSTTGSRTTDNHLRLRADGRFEVDATDEANVEHGCMIDGWCILDNGHAGPCEEQREGWIGEGDTWTNA